MPEWNALASQPDDTVPLLETALLIARDEYPDLDPGPGEPGFAPPLAHP